MNLNATVVLGIDHQRAQRTAHRNVKELADDIRAWPTTWRENPRPSVWTETAEPILERLTGYWYAIKTSA